jgi:hypothetical protein
MDYIDPHIHMVSRTTDDYETLARMGCVAMSEPAFWAGFDRGSVETQACCSVRHPALHVALHQCKGSRERIVVARSDRDDPRIPFSQQCFGDR